MRDYAIPILLGVANAFSAGWILHLYLTDEVGWLALPAVFVATWASLLMLSALHTDRLYR